MKNTLYLENAHEKNFSNNLDFYNSISSSTSDKKIRLERKTETKREHVSGIAKLSRKTSTITSSKTEKEVKKEPKKERKMKGKKTIFDQN